MAPTWNDEFTLPDGSYSVSDIQDYTKYIIKKHETFTTTSPIHFFINRVNKRLVFKKKDDYKFELQTSETMKLFGSSKKIIDKTKSGENVPSLQVAGAVWVQHNSVDY